jgi:hypothetical protein
MVRRPMRKLVILLAAAVASAGCGAGPPQPEFAWDHAASFANVKTYAWYDGPPFQYPHGGGIVDGRFIDEHVRRDVEAELGRKGYVKADGGSPDIFVTYHTDPAGIADRDVWGQYSWWSPYIHVGTAYEKSGALALDVRDPGKKLVWRGMVARSIGNNPEDVARAIEKAVADLLKNFPPPPSASK